MFLKHLTTLGGRGQGPDKWKMRLAGLACDDAGVWVLGDETVRQFDREGHPLADFEPDRLGWSLGLDRANQAVWIGFDGEAASYTREGQRFEGFRDAPRLGRVTAIERVDDRVVVGDATGRCLRVYDLDGRWLCDIGNNNRTQGLLIPNGVVDFDVDRRSNTLVVVNPAKHRLERYSLDGELLGFWGRFGMHDDANFSGCCNPTNIALASDGRVLVTEKAPPRLKLYTEAGEFLAATSTELFDPQAKNMCLAATDDHVYVADTARLTVLVYALAPSETARSSGNTSTEPLAGAVP